MASGYDYQKESAVEQILHRPESFIGSIEPDFKTLWVYDDCKMIQRPISFVQGLYRIFDEILVNAADNKRRDPKMDALKVVIDANNNLIRVYNNGAGVPVEMDDDESVYVPELMFGHLLTSSNYEDSEKKTTGGRNGFGAKLANIFSTKFIIETADGKQKKKYEQVFSNNMRERSDPVIVDSKVGENWTRVTFNPDLVRFKMTNLDDDVVALMKKRVIEIAGYLGESVKVELNETTVHVKSFQDYLNLYSVPPPSFYEKVGERWEICVSITTDCQFQQVSFVNGIATIEGGTHVDYVTNQIANYVMNVANKKDKSASVEAHNVKSHLWVFVNALIDNPVFDSRTKETLNLHQSKFGSKCKLTEDFLSKVTEDFLSKVVKKSGIITRLSVCAKSKQETELKKTGGTKRRKVNVPKLEDATEAGGRHSNKCTLILTEGDSAKALAIAGLSGLSKASRDYYGVFPLKGKLLNVRDAGSKKIRANKEIQSIKKILGLQQNMEYTNTNSLRYGQLMIMTDQDHDGSHIKGLIINFIHYLWPSLLKVKSFMVEFVTPIVKATHKNNTVLPFYSMPEYEKWKENLRESASGFWSIKYYKGLGTSTSKEGKEYFKNLGNHMKDFVWVDGEDGAAIELAFSKKNIEARKDWLLEFKPGTHLDHTEKRIKYRDFINKELILFSMADVKRSIPSMVDGMKPGQRKILFCCFKKNFVEEVKVSVFSGYVSEHSAYHHGETSLAGTIIGIAQDYVGSNNINLLQPKGQFGTRTTGGKDHASARYIYTKLSTITRLLFPEDDDCLLMYLNEDGQSIEPTWYLPIIPMILVNGCGGIGTGWSTFIPNYNPRDVINNIRCLLAGKSMKPMIPWYRGYKGAIKNATSKDSYYTVDGVIRQLNETTVKIEELPIRKWTEDYIAFLNSVTEGIKDDKGKLSKNTFVKGFENLGDDASIDFEVSLDKEKMKKIAKQNLLNKFKLSSSICTTNMHLFDHSGVLKKYDSPEQILHEFFDLRLQYYEKRRIALMRSLELELMKLENKLRFIDEVGYSLDIRQNRAELCQDLFVDGFTLFRKKAKAVVVGETNDTVEGPVNFGNSEKIIGYVDSDYDYLLSMPIKSWTKEKYTQLLNDKFLVSEKLDALVEADPPSMWLKDLDKLELQLQDLENYDAEAEVAARKKNTKKATNAESAVGTSSSVPTESAPVVVKPKGGARKAPAKKKEPTLVLEDEDRLQRYKLDDSSPEKSAEMETDVPPPPQVAAAVQKKQPAKRAPAGRKKAQTIAADDDSDVEVVVAPPVKGGRGSKPAATKAAAKPPAGPKKRTTGQKPD